MPTPKQKTSWKRRGDRRKHLALKPMSLAICSHCQARVLPHHACPDCGYYRERQVFAIEDKTLRGKKGKEKGKGAGADKEAKEPEADQDKPLTLQGLSKK